MTVEGIAFFFSFLVCCDQTVNAFLLLAMFMTHSVYSYKALERLLIFFLSVVSIVGLEAGIRCLCRSVAEGHI